MNMAVQITIMIEKEFEVDMEELKCMTLFEYIKEHVLDDIQEEEINITGE
tara:strand:- start:2372 stop:2521 length:150 start_codon:yes stop_codon:yes gene_type:complete